MALRSVHYPHWSGYSGFSGTWNAPLFSASCSGFSGFSGATFSGRSIGIPCAPVCVMDQINTNLAAIVSAGFLTVYEGKKRIPETVDLDQQLRTGKAEAVGIYVYDIASCESKTQTGTGTLNIQGVLQTYLPSDTDSLLHCTYQLAGMIQAAMADEASFFGCSSKPVSVIWTPSDDGVDDKVLQVVFTAVYQIPMTPGPMVG